MQNNAINTGPIATLTEAIAGSDTTKLITPYTAYRTVLARGLTATTQNLGLTVSSGLVVNSANGTALSTSNVGVVIIPSKTMGEFNTFYLTANQSFLNANMTGNLFGTTASVAWGNNARFYLYAVSNDAEDTCTLMISRINSRVVAPVAANIGTPSSAIADTQGSFFASSNITPSDYEGNPCVMLGSFNMTKSAGDAWTVNTLLRDSGIGVNGVFLSTFPLGQFGAAASRIMLNNGGTAPNFTTSLIQYMLLPNGQCMMFVNLNTTTAGAGAVNTQMTIPFAPAYDTQPLVGGDIFLAGATTGYYPVLHSANYVEFKRISNGSFLLNSTSTANVAFVLTYQVSDQ